MKRRFKIPGMVGSYVISVVSDTKALIIYVSDSGLKINVDEVVIDIPNKTFVFQEAYRRLVRSYGKAFVVAVPASK